MLLEKRPTTDGLEAHSAHALKNIYIYLLISYTYSILILYNYIIYIRIILLSYNDINII